MNTKQKKLLSDIWHTFEYHLENIDWTSYTDKIYQLALEESRNHDVFRPDGSSRKMSLIQEARYFALKRFAEYAIENQEAPQATDFLMMQRSCFAAYSIATHDRFKNARSAILAKHTKDLKELLTWDYSELIR